MQQSLSQGHDWHWSNAINARSNCVNNQRHEGKSWWAFGRTTFPHGNKRLWTQRNQSGRLQSGTKNRFDGIKDNFVDIIIAQVKERFPEKDMQVLKVFNTIPNLAKLPGTGAEIRNHGIKNLERLLERCWCIWRRKSNWCWWSKKFIYPV